MHFLSGQCTWFRLCYGAERDHSTALVLHRHISERHLHCDDPSHGRSLVGDASCRDCDVAQRKRHEASPVAGKPLASTPAVAPAVTPAVAPAATPTARPTSTPAALPTVVIGKRDLSLEAHSVQDLEALADARLLWDLRSEETADRGKRG